MENNASQPAQPVNPPPPPAQPHKFPLVAIVLVTFLIASGSIYFLKMRSTKPTQINQQNSTPPTTTVSKQPTQIPENAVFRLPVNGKHIEVHANALKNTDNIPITSIRSYEVSPDKTKIALLADGGISTLFLYVTDINGEQAVFIGSVPKDSDLQWSMDSQSISADSPSGKQSYPLPNSNSSK